MKSLSILFTILRTVTWLLKELFLQGFIEMALTSDAERIAADSKNQDIVLRGNILKIKVSEKYCRLPGER